jgi:hypothetical protein
MPPGAGKRDLHISIGAEEKSYLEAEARYRRVPVSTLLLDACDIVLHPERAERGALADELLAVAQTLAKLQPQLQALQATAARSEALDRELRTLRAEVHQSLAGVQGELSRLGDTRRAQQIRRYGVGGATIAFGATVLYLYWPAFSMAVLVMLLGTVMMLI